MRFTAAFEEVEDYKDPEAVSSLRERLDSLIAEAASRKAETATTAEGAPAVGGPGYTSGPAVAGGPAVSAAPSGIALTATYSAAAARISGYQPSTAGPEEKMVSGIAAIDKKADEMLTKADGLTEKAEELIGVVGKFLAGWVVS